jgi:hypothetical protein
MTVENEEMTVEKYLAIRTEAALKIDPETAEFISEWGQIMDPYGIKKDLPPECHCVGRLYFARSPGGDVWVWFYDLPEATLQRLRQRINRGELKEADIDWL